MKHELFVLDCSVNTLWAYEDTTNPTGSKYAKQVLEHILAKKARALVPNIWPLEVSNVLLKLEKHGVLTFHECTDFIKRIQKLPIQLDTNLSLSPEKNYALAREYELSSYDAAYLDLAMRHQIPLATNDKKLKQVAKETVGLL